MKKFKFRLQKLLDIREAEEKEIKNELSHAVSKQNVFRNKQRDYTDKVNEYKNTLHNKLKDGSMDFQQVKLYHRFSDIADKVVVDSQRKIEELEPGINEIRGRLMEVTKKRRTIEKLKEKKKKEWDYNVQRAETRENDDINQKIFMRKFLNDGQD